MAKNEGSGKDGERVVMKLIGQAVDALVEVAPEICSKHVVYEGKTKVLYLWVPRMRRNVYEMRTYWCRDE